MMLLTVVLEKTHEYSLDILLFLFGTSHIATVLKVKRAARGRGPIRVVE